MIFKAAVNCSFNTSIEVGVKVEVENMFTGERHTTGRAYLTFVAINKDGKPIKVPEAIPETEEEKKRMKEAQERRKLRLEQRKRMEELHKDS